MFYVRRYAPFCTVAVAIVCLYLYKLDAVGVLDPDEPRYLAIGRSMAASHDYVTPRLWGTPWFEKPALLYWLTSAGALLGLPPELSGRLPVALLSLGFLGAMFHLVRREFGFHAAGFAVSLLATSAGWLTYSSLALTDIPLAVFFSLAVLVVLPLLHLNRENAPQLNARLLAAGACIGLAALAKGLVPIALSVPFVWFLRAYWRKFWLAFASAAAVALPWYVLVYLINGRVFLYDFFWRHHVERLYSASLQHVQPPYYYVPILLAAVFPWTPLFGLLFSRAFADDRRKFLGAIVAFGFLFFSISLNKLPGYLLPLLPSAFVLLGSQFEYKRPAEISRLWFAGCAVLIGMIPILARLLPQTLLSGRLSFANVDLLTKTDWVYIVAPLVVAIAAKRSYLTSLLVLGVAFGGLFLKIVAYPSLEQFVSPRGFWRAAQLQPSDVCDGGGLSRRWTFGISFYRGSFIPPCSSGNARFALELHDHEKPVLRPLKP